MKNVFVILVLAACCGLMTACENCQTCSHYQGGVAGGSITEERDVCDEDEAAMLEASSTSINDNWTCQ